jgi:hypothetical protein
MVIKHQPPRLQELLIQRDVLNKSIADAEAAGATRRASMEATVRPRGSVRVLIEERMCACAAGMSPVGILNEQHVTHKLNPMAI